MSTLSDLAAAHAALVAAQADERRAVHEARAAGHSWEEIADAIGLTATGAHYRYSEGAPAPTTLSGLSIRDYARTVPESAAFIAANLAQYEHVVVEYRGRRIVRILGKEDRHG